MRQITAMIFLVGLVSRPSGAQMKPDSSLRSAIVGAWEAASPTQTGMAVTIDFAANRSVVIVTAAMVNWQYKVVGTSLKLIGAPGDTIDVPFSFHGDTLIELIAGNDNKMTRVPGSPRGAGIVGKWTYMHPSGAPAFEEYLSDGNAHIRIPMMTELGSYEISGGNLLLHMRTPSPNERSSVLRLMGDTLTLESARPREYYRVH